jgi:PhoPQ-activated pathogenicity-related protein
MMRHKTAASRLVIALCLVMPLAVGSAASVEETALDRYIAKPDPSYAWKLVNTIPGEGYNGYVLELTSQTWRTEAEVDRPVWKHWLTVVKPEKLSTSKGLLFIGGGSNREPMPSTISARLSLFALESHSVVA